MSAGTLYILNGGSSAGKSSLARAFQEQLKRPSIHLGIDHFWCSLPPSQLDLHQVDPSYYRWRVSREKGLDYFEIIPGKILNLAMAARYPAIRSYLDVGFHVVADEVLWRREWLIDALKALEDYRVYLIGVHVSDEEGARRESMRGDRHSGWNRGSARVAHRNCPKYDYEIDTTIKSPEECAKELVQEIEAGLKPRAFEQLQAELIMAGIGV